MSVLKGFLQPSPMGATKEVIISERFKGEDGKPLPFKVRAIDQATNSELIKLSTREKKGRNGQMIKDLNRAEYTNRLILACVTEPNMKDTELCQYYGVVDPLMVPEKMLSVGEYSRLSDAIMEINDLGEEAAEAIEEEAKNS